jgi:galactokinase/mevalonate kinase-like predicted kinase
VIYNTNITTAGAKALSEAAENCWTAILRQDIVHFGQHVRQSFEAQIAMFPNMMTDLVANLVAQVQDWALGWKLSGAGGGGYLIVVSDKPVEGAIQVIVRRGD